LRKVDVAVVGTGWCGGIRAETLARSPLVDCLHIAETRPERLAEATGAATAVSDYRALLDIPEIEAVYICATPETTHYPMARDALMRQRSGRDRLKVRRFNAKSHYLTSRDQFHAAGDRRADLRLADEVPHDTDALVQIDEHDAVRDECREFGIGGTVDDGRSEDRALARRRLACECRRSATGTALALQIPPGGAGGAELEGYWFSRHATRSSTRLTWDERTPPSP
jgi:hypothetical protein